MRLSPKAFWRLTWRQYLSAAGGYHRREVARWRHTRLLATVLLNINRAEGEPALSPEDVLPLPGDPPPPLPISAEAFAEADARLAALDADIT